MCVVKTSPLLTRTRHGRHYRDGQVCGPDLHRVSVSIRYNLQLQGLASHNRTRPRGRTAPHLRWSHIKRRRFRAGLRYATHIRKNALLRLTSACVQVLRMGTRFIWSRVRGQSRPRQALLRQHRRRQLLQPPPNVMCAPTAPPSPPFPTATSRLMLLFLPPQMLTNPDLMAQMMESPLMQVRVVRRAAGVRSIGF